MRIEFICPRTKEIQTEDVCLQQYEYDACMGCTSQQDAARKALFDVLTEQYGHRASIQLQEDGVLISVRDGLRILADPGDWRDTIVEIDCGVDGNTHLHPADVFQWVEDFMKGRIMILLSEDHRRSAVSCKAYYDDAAGLCQWSRVVDVEGSCTPQEYLLRGR